jgi:hypothetical protein
MNELNKMDIEEFSSHFARRIADTIIQSGFLHLRDAVRLIVSETMENTKFGFKRRSLRNTKSLSKERRTAPGSSKSKQIIPKKRLRK